MKDYDFKALVDARDPKRFVESWKNAIKTHYDMSKYEDLKEMDPTKKKNLEKILRWKNGGRFLESHEKYSNSLLKEWSRWEKKSGKLNQPKKKQIKNFINSREIHGVYDCFLLHLQSPNKYPIIDRHAYEAYSYIKGIPVSKLSTSKYKFHQQYDQYIQFFNQFVIDSMCSRKDVDNALWGFGKYLSILRKQQIDAENEKE